MHLNAANQLFTDLEADELREAAVSRTISTVPEISLSASVFCQPIDIGIDLKGDTTVPIKNMENYPLRSVENTILYIRLLLDAGITTIMLRMDAPKKYKTHDKLIRAQAQVLKKIRKEYSSKELVVIVDPFSVALNPDKTWGIQVGQVLDFAKTSALFSRLTQAFEKSGASYVLTLGRFEREVDITKRTLVAADSVTKVASFSTNTETTNAYVYADHGAYSRTKQKILVSNFQEMVFRALVDIYEGSNLIIIKPSENLHVISKLVFLIRYPELLKEFLLSPQVESLVSQSVYLRRVRSLMLENTACITKKQDLRIAAYTVSGTYFMDTQTLHRRGDEFMANVLYERFCNINSAIDGMQPGTLIIDRNAHWFIDFLSKNPDCIN